VGAISGTGNTFTGNVAWGGMVPGDGGVPFTTDADNHGTNITTEEVKDGTNLPASLKIDPWTYSEGSLPILTGLEGQSNALPGYLQ
jgi:hypothetical protein